MGPLAIALSPLPHGVYNVVIAALALPVLLMAARPLRVDGVGASRRWAWSAASLLLVAPWAQLAWKGHADDALVLVGAAVMVTALAAKRHRWLLPGWVIAVAGKPTALALAPFLLASPLWLLVCVAVTAAIWGPFAAADPGALMRAGQGVMAVVPGDGLAYLGVATGRPPVWVRPVQLLLSWAGSLLGLLRARPAAGLLLGLAARAVLEPNPAPAYSISLVAVALFVDAGRRVPLATVLAATSFWTSQTVLQGGSGWPRILSLMALVGWAGWVASGKALELAGSPLGLSRARATRGVSAIAAAGLWTGVMVVPAQAAPPVLKQGSLGDGVRCVQWGVNHLLPPSRGTHARSGWTVSTGTTPPGACTRCRSCSTSRSTTPTCTTGGSDRGPAPPCTWPGSPPLRTVALHRHRSLRPRADRPGQDRAARPPPLRRHPRRPDQRRPGAAPA